MGNNLINKGAIIWLTFGLLFGICFAIPLGGTGFNSVRSVTNIESELWTLEDYNTLHPNNESWNLSIGKNEITTYKLYVNGTSYFNDSMDIAGNIVPTVNTTYNLGSNLLHWLHVYADTFYANGGNSSLWNIAFGWGDHGVAGYLTSTGNPFNQDLNTTDNASFTYLDIANDVNVSGDETVTGYVSASNYTSTVATGTSPYACSSTTLNTNLNADLLDSKHVGTSGNTIPLLDAINTWSGVQTMGTTTKLQFRDSGIFIHSNTDGNLTIEADEKVTIGVAGDIELGDGTERLMFPNTDTKINLGNSTNRFNRLFLSNDANISGKLNVTDNSTFFDNVTIHGTLFGGSPVKIAGINIINNLFSHKEDTNSSLRFTLQNLNDSMNASSVISAKNDVDSSMSIGIGSSSFCVDTTPYPNVTALFSRSQGKTVFANFFNQPYLWLYNPQDDNDPANLVEIMSLDENGLNISGNLTSNFYHAEIWEYSTDGSLFEINASGIYYNLTLINNTGSLEGFTYTPSNGEAAGGVNLTCDVTGKYKVDFSMSFQASVSGGDYGICVAKNRDPTISRNTYARRTGTGNTGNIGITGFMDIYQGDMINVLIEDESAPTKDIVVYTINLNLIRIGDI